MKKLIAARPILYRGRMYERGEQLPGDDAKMVDAWLKHGSAKLTGGGATVAPEPETDAGVTPPADKGADGAHAPDDATTARLDPAQLETLKIAELRQLAADMGVDISAAKTKQDIVDAIASVDVTIPPDAENENGGAQ